MKQLVYYRRFRKNIWWKPRKVVLFWKKNSQVGSGHIFEELKLTVIIGCKLNLVVHLVKWYWLLIYSNVSFSCFSDFETHFVIFVQLGLWIWLAKSMKHPYKSREESASLDGATSCNGDARFRTVFSCEAEIIDQRNTCLQLVGFWDEHFYLADC